MKATVPCRLFRPGRALPHGECECGWMRVDHVASAPGYLREHQGQPSDAERSAAWEETARQAHEGREYYRRLLVAIGEMFGEAAHIYDDGSWSEDVSVANVPELVRLLMAAANFTKCHASDTPDPGPVTGCDRCKGNFPVDQVKTVTMPIGMSATALQMCDDCRRTVAQNEAAMAPKLAKFTRLRLEKAPGVDLSAPSSASPVAPQPRSDTTGTVYTNPQGNNPTAPGRPESSTNEGTGAESKE